MNGVDIADRLRITITSNGGYEKISQLTGISVSTLKRSASGKTEPKFKDIVNIADKTNTSISYLAYGDAKLNPEMQAKVIVDAMMYFNTGEDDPKIDPNLVNVLFAMFGGLVESLSTNSIEVERYQHLSSQVKELFKEQNKSK